MDSSLTSPDGGPGGRAIFFILPLLKKERQKMLVMKIIFLIREMCYQDIQSMLNITKGSISLTIYNVVFAHSFP